jgi:integrase
MALTAKRVERLKTPGRYSDEHGLYLQVTNADNRSWIFRFERDGKEFAMGLGPTHTVSLSLAREKARAARLQLLDGVNPLQARRDAKAHAAAATAKAITFGEAAQGFFDGNAASWKSEKHTAQWMQSVLGKTASSRPCDPKYDHCRSVRPLPVADIDTALVLRVIEPMWSTTPETAARVRARIEAVLAWATVRGYRSGPNPAQWKNHLEHILPKKSKVTKVKNFASVPYAEVPAVMLALALRSGSAAAALRFLVLTAARSGEVREARWSEINLADATWTIPAERMKAGKAHKVPLAPAAMELLASLPHEDGTDLVFIGPQRGKPISDTALISVMRRMGLTAVPHGFRSSFATWASEQTNFANAVREMALAHSVGSAVEKSYQRSDLFVKRRKLAEAWAAFCLSPPVEQAGDNVVSMRG